MAFRCLNRYRFSSVSTDLERGLQKFPLQWGRTNLPLMELLTRLPRGIFGLHVQPRHTHFGNRTIVSFNHSSIQSCLHRMRIVGLTGGIASGKSTTSNLFKTNGIPVVDADVIARDVLRKGTGGWKRVVAAFGEDILQDNGEVDRARLGQLVFSDPAKRKLLNGLLAPFISSGIFWEVAKLWIKGSKVIVLDIPLLFEAKMDRFTNPIIVVWVDSETQLQRLMARDGISEEQALNRINAQTPLDWKRSKADIIIDNSGSLEETKEQFQRVLAQVTRPLTWREFGLSRNGALWALVSVTLGVLLFRYFL